MKGMGLGPSLSGTELAGKIAEYRARGFSEVWEDGDHVLAWRHRRSQSERGTLLANGFRPAEEARHRNGIDA